MRSLLHSSTLTSLQTSLSSLEGSGIVTAVGSEVHDLKPGNWAIFLAENCLSTSITIPATQAAKLPDTLALEEAANMLLPFSTAIYSLTMVASLRKGQKVLLHDAVSAAGLAGIQVCQMLGAEVYCTVDSEDAVEHLVTDCNVPRERILVSSSTSFLPWLMGATAGKGVDAVLLRRSMPAELLRAHWKCVAPRGKVCFTINFLAEIIAC
jgi:NADPH:quinone reductase-like Zn-dependent oxidoreductase